MKEQKLKSNHAFISLAYYHLFNQNIQNNQLQKYVNTIDNFGDKDLIKDLLLQSWIQESYEVSDHDKVYDISELDLTKFKLPITSNFPPSTLFNMYKFFILNEFNNFADRKLDNFFPIDEIITKSYLTIPKVSSLFFSEEKGSGDVDCAETYTKLYDCVNKNPKELTIVIDYFEGAYSNYIANCTSVSKTAYCQLIEEKAIEQYPIILYTFQCLQLEEQILIKKNPSFLETKNLEDICFKLLNRSPTSKEKDFYGKILSANSEESLKIVHYLIMTSVEYNYY
jgi:hypothetical protein